MPAPKGNKNAVGNKGGGRPSLYKPEYAEMARKIAMLGATDVEIAGCFGVSEGALTSWKLAHVEFKDALKKGKLPADGEVVESLFRRAKGYSHEAVKIVADAKTGAEHIVPYTEHYPPDTTACIFWLKNRRPDLWRDKHEVEHAGNLKVTDERVGTVAGLVGELFSPAGLSADEPGSGGKVVH